MDRKFQDKLNREKHSQLTLRIYITYIYIHILNIIDYLYIALEDRLKQNNQSCLTYDRQTHLNSIPMNKVDKLKSTTCLYNLYSV